MPTKEVVEIAKAIGKLQGCSSSKLPELSWLPVSNPKEVDHDHHLCRNRHGLDVESIITKLIAVEIPITQLNTKQQSYKDQLSAYGRILSSFSSMQTAAGKLDSTTDFQGIRQASPTPTTLPPRQPATPRPVRMRCAWISSHRRTSCNRRSTHRSRRGH